MTKINRREFLRIGSALGKAAGLSVLLEACAKVGIRIPPVDPTTQIPTSAPIQPSDTPETISPTSQPFTETPTSTTIIPSSEEGTKIALVRTTDRSAGVRQAMDLLGINPVEGKRVFLKANYNSADATPGSTHQDVLRITVSWLQEMGAQSIMLGDRSGMGDTRQVLTQRGVFEMAEELGFEVIVFDDLDAGGWVKFTPAGSHWPRGFLFSRACLEADAVVQMCCLKTHQYGGYFTLSLKNSVGLVAKYDPQDQYNYMEELHSTRDQRKMIAEINAVYSPALIVLDGVEAFVNGGPATGEVVQSGVILAGTDRIAMDAVGVAILRNFGTTAQVSRGKIFELEQIARAVELGLGIDNPQKISFVTGDESSAAFAEELRQQLLSG